MTAKSQEKSEELLVEAAQNGHLESFAALYKAYHSPMVALAYSMLADRELAEDAAGEVFAIACGELAKLRRKEKFGTWLAGICRNTARQMLRAKGKHVALNFRSPGEDADIDQHQRDLIRQAVRQLRPAERELIVLRYYDNMPYEQIAGILDISIQAVNGRLIRAKRKIAKYLKRNGLAGGDYENA